ncbi:MAG: hypothetical protein IPF54_26870 [Draconibacterium sp.]|nr:hypothetical protein [Draconibacterium sp.]
MVKLIFPFSVYSRKALIPATPSEDVLEMSIWSERKVEKTFISYLARDMATFNLRQPPSRFKGPKFKYIFPSWSGP